MKPKKIPRAVSLFLFLMGIWMGALISTILTAIATIIPLALWILLAFFAVVMLSWWLITWRCRATLEEWDLLEPRKERKKK